MSCRMQPRKRERLGHWVSFVFFGGSLLNWSAPAMAASNVTSIDFKGTENPSEVLIRTNEPAAFNKLENQNDKQIVVELKDTSIAANEAKKIDTSSFQSNVSLVSPYQANDNTVRVVIQLREPGTADVTQIGNLIQVKIPNKGGSGSDSPQAAPKPPAPADGAPAPSPESLPNSENETNQVSAESVPPVKMKLEEYMDSKTTQKFTGKPITLQVQDADVADVLRLIGETSGFNLLLGEDVKGKITLSLVDVPWDQALDVILHSLKLGAERSNNILRISSLANMTAEKQEELKAIQAAEAVAPRVTRVFPISYAKLAELQVTVTKLIADPALGAAPNANASLVQADQRTNSLIVRDVPKNIEKIKKLIEILDTQTPQVMIEAKIVEATESFSKSMGGSLGFTPGDASGFVSSNGANPVDPLLGSPGVFTGTTIGKQGGTGGIFGFSPNLSFLAGTTRLNAVLTWGENDSELKVVASPKTVVLNKETANIVEGTPVLIPTTTQVAGVGSTQSVTVQNANVSLMVKPTVTNDGSILLDLNVSKDVPVSLGTAQGIGNRNMKTIVLVESGSTLVIGGIYTMQTNHASSGIPILRKIPLIGTLFGSESDNTSRHELFIFVTPRILNSKAAGLSA